MRLYATSQVPKVWSTPVDLLGNISMSFDVGKAENRPKSWKIRMAPVCLLPKMTGRPENMVDSAFEN